MVCLARKESGYILRLFCLCTVLYLTVTSIGCHVESIGMPNSERFREIARLSGLRTAPSQLSDFLRGEYQGIVYDIAYAKQDLAYFVCTADRSFQTPDGIDFSNDYAGLVLRFGVDNFKVLEGWGTFLELPSGWCILFSCDKADGEPKKNETPVLFFKIIKQRPLPTIQDVMSYPSQYL